MKKIWFLFLMTLFLSGCLAGEKSDDNLEGFSYTENDMGEEACYVSVVYLDGYSYSPNEWLASDWYGKQKTYVRGQSIGSVTLDLKGKTYTGIPPNFSSTLDVGTELFEIEGVKRESAILVVNGHYESVFYINSKVLENGAAFNLSAKAILQLVSDQPDIEAIEVRDETNGTWVADLEDPDLLDLLEQAFVDQELLTREALSVEPYSSQRLPINVVFSDGARLHMQVYPQSSYAYVFGGYMAMSGEFVDALKETIATLEIPPSLASLVFEGHDVLEEMLVSDVLRNQDYDLEEPKWTGQALEHLLSYYRVKAIAPTDSPLIFYAEIKSPNQAMTRFEIFEDGSVGVDGHRYEILKGSLGYGDVEFFLEAYIE